MKPPHATPPAPPSFPPATSDAIPATCIVPEYPSLPTCLWALLYLSFSGATHHYHPRRAVEGIHLPPKVRRNMQSTTPHGFGLLCNTASNQAAGFPDDFIVGPTVIVHQTLLISFDNLQNVADIIPSVKNRSVSEKMTVIKHRRHPPTPSPSSSVNPIKTKKFAPKKKHSKSKSTKPSESSKPKSILIAQLVDSIRPHIFIDGPARIDHMYD